MSLERIRAEVLARHDRQEAGRAALAEICTYDVTSEPVWVFCTRCDEVLARLYELPDDRLVFVSRIEFIASDLLSTTPWMRDELVAALPGAPGQIMNDDANLEAEWRRLVVDPPLVQETNGGRWLKNTPPQYVVDVVNLPPRLGRDFTPDLWVRCKNHRYPRTVDHKTLRAAGLRARSTGKRQRLTA